MAYKALDENGIGDYIRYRPSMQGKFSPNAHFSVLLQIMIADFKRAGTNEADGLDLHN